MSETFTWRLVSPRTSALGVMRTSGLIPNSRRTNLTMGSKHVGATAIGNILSKLDSLESHVGNTGGDGSTIAGLILHEGCVRNIHINMPKMLFSDRPRPRCTTEEQCMSRVSVPKLGMRNPDIAGVGIDCRPHCAVQEGAMGQCERDGGSPLSQFNGRCRPVG